MHVLDAKYDKAESQSGVIINCTHLSCHDQNNLLDLLTEYEELFDWTLGDWKTKSIFELREGTKPYYGRPFLKEYTKKQ